MSSEASRTCSEVISHFRIQNHQSQLENRLTFSLLSRYLTYQFHSVNPKKLHFAEMQAISEESSLLIDKDYEFTRIETARRRPMA